MINFKKNRKILLIFSLVFPTILALNLLLPSVQGGPYVPEENPKNGWHWEVDVGDQLYFEAEFILTNVSTGEVYMMFKDIWIYNITSIENVTIYDWFGINNVSQVNATQCYYNVTAGEIEPYDISQEFALFGYNSTSPITHKYRAGYNGVPFLLPLNGSHNIQVDILADVLNETFYSSYYEMAFNRFDYYEFNTGSNRLYFYNTSEHYFTECYYYDNGTLNSATAYLMANMGDGPIYINATMKQVFDYDITDEIEWGVNVGDKIYYELYEGEATIDDAGDILIEIVGFSDELFEKNKNSFSDEPSYMVFQTVYANISEWKGREYDVVEINYPLASANNFYPQYFDLIGASPYNFLYPSNSLKEDFEFMWNNDTLRIWDVPFDEIYYYENGNFEALLKNSTSEDFARIISNKSTGIVQSNFIQQDHYIIYLEIKSMTLVDWSVNLDDTIYYKQNEDNLRDLKITILETNLVYVNMSLLVEEYNYYGIPITLPIDQPEHQFFSYIIASFEEWDPITESWGNYGEDILAIANIYWPMSPLIFEIGGVPLLMPEDTSSSELTGIFDMFSPVYDDITYDTGLVILRNSTLDRTLNFYFNEASGRVTMMYGWATLPVPGSEWNYISYYPKYYRACPSGTNSFQQQNDFSMDLTVDVEFEVSIGGPGVEYIYALLPYNPVNVSLLNGTALAYFDQLIVNYGLIDGNMTMTMTLPSSLNLKNIEIFFFAFNMSGTGEWNEAPPEFYDTIIYDYGANSLTIETPAWGPMSVISAMSYRTIEIVEEPLIPGYSPLIFIIALITIVGILIKKKYK